MKRHNVVRHVGTMLLCAGLAVTACAKKPSVLAPQPAPPPATATAPPPSTATAPPPQRVEEALSIPQQPVAEDVVGSRSVDDLNRDSPLKPAFFPLDSSDLDDVGRAVVTANADVLKRYQTWVITVEGHCDERGTAEYNLALGERRAINVKTYLVSLGIPADRIRTVSYGKEFPFDAGHNDQAWASNRRAHFVITSK